jgi:hypothetical protein
MQVEAIPNKPRNNEAGINVSPMRNGTHKPTMINPTEISIHGRGSSLFTHLMRSMANSLTCKLDAYVDLKTRVWVVMYTSRMNEEYHVENWSQLMANMENTP